MANYVKFLRGSPIAFKQLKEANQLNDDTLYFIYEKDATDGDLYLGSKLIAGSEALSSLSDIEISSEGLTDNQVLAYDAGSGKWVNMTLEKAITDIFVGATEHSSGVAGLVPAPDKGNIDSFLRSDGSWVAIDKMDIYQGNGIEITEENDKRIIGVKIADTDTHLISDENGLSINLDEYALNSEAKANNGIRYINQIEIDKLNKLVIEDGDITVSGSIEAAQVKNLYTVVENIITGTSVTEDLDPDTEGI